MKKSILLLLCLIPALLVNSQSPGSLQTKAGYLILDGDSIYYEWTGSGQTLILIHDGLLHREVWNEQFSYFSKNYRVVRYDRRGYGASSAARASYTHLGDLNALFEQLGVEHAVLVACSSGGALAIDCALAYPRKVDALVLVGAVVGGFSYTPHMHTRGGHLSGGFESELEEALYYVKDDPYEIYTENKYAKEKALAMIYAHPPKENRRQQFIRPEIPAYRRLGEISIPTLILVGEYDIPDVHAHAGAIDAGIANSHRRLIPGSGHLVPLEQPALFNELLHTFLTDMSE
jgi:pimeloyl-ACP methyl ester carboxylesterase